jgi:hypothetical protein
MMIIVDAALTLCRDALLHHHLLARVEKPQQLADKSAARAYRCAPDAAEVCAVRDQQATAGRWRGHGGRWQPHAAGTARAVGTTAALPVGATAVFLRVSRQWAPREPLCLHRGRWHQHARADEGWSVGSARGWQRGGRG